MAQFAPLSLYFSHLLTQHEPISFETAMSDWQASYEARQIGKIRTAIPIRDLPGSKHWSTGTTKGS